MRDSKQHRNEKTNSTKENKKNIPGVPESGPGSADVERRVRRLPTPPSRRRPHREREALNHLVERARRDRARRRLEPDEVSCQRIARKQLKKLYRTRRDPAHGVGHKIGPSDRRTFRQDLLNVKALRESDFGQELREQMRTRLGGRPSDHSGAIAIQELLLWSAHPWTVRSAYALLEQGRNDWPTYTLGPNCHELVCMAATYDAIGGARRRDGHGRRPGLTDRIDPTFFDRAIAETARALGEYAGGQFDRVLSIDGTLSRVAAQQRQSFSAEDEKEIDRNLSAGFGTHGKAFLRGYNVMALVAPSMTVPVAVTVERANIGERGHTLGLLKTLYKYWPDAAPEFLAADAGFDSDWRLYRDLMMRYGINLVAVRSEKDKPPAHLKNGLGGAVPVCTCSGSAQMMRMYSADEFWGPEKRRKMGLAPGQDAEQAMQRAKARMRVRYECREPGCISKRVDIDPRQDIDGTQPNWRYATRLPHHNIHRTRHEQRGDILSARNSSESVWNVMKAAGVDASGAMVTRWQNTRAQHEATIKAKLLRHSGLKLLERDGTLERIYAEATAEGYIRKRR